MSQIQPFYSQSNVLITGGTGFLGKILIQKLLRTCNNIERIFLIIRAKRDKNATERADEIFQDVVFDVLKKEEPNFLKKINIIEGDCALPELGLSEANKNLLIDKINIVFHCAGLVNFKATLKIATYTNIRSLKDLLALCQKMQNLKAMVFVSTSYSNCQEWTIEETFHDVPIQPSTLLKLVEECDNQVLECTEKRFLKNSPNMYCFTKLIAENLLLNDGKNLPICLFRPSMVLSTYSDPVPGWTSNLYGPLGMSLSILLGVVRLIPCHKNYKMDVVPVDFVINSLICVAWETHIQWKTLSTCDNPPIPVYNYSGGYEGILNYEKYYDLLLSQYKYKMTSQMWICSTFMVANKLAFIMLFVLIHTVPECILEVYLFLTGQKLRFINLYDKLNNTVEDLHYFIRNEWNIINTNVTRLWQRLNVTDQELFPFDMSLLNYEEYWGKIILGLKVYILKDNLDNIEADNKNYKRLENIHQAAVTIITIFFLLFFCKVLTHYL